ncbi:hypothetical protein AK812_SmicGene33088 [Symbiodinium microadriaticum]|uniref:Uncharacterized protein n=1 Tax=Symbiodinium microadriaticum TaxID=2951 RepID=A0A1Q9CSI3_SYMMI|nr:hypothetical protein AK812_SmicGene33088 [Symbiodinium microadriaticum]
MACLTDRLPQTNATTGLLGWQHELVDSLLTDGILKRFRDAAAELQDSPSPSPPQPGPVEDIADFVTDGH